jgi:6-phosphofructokinase 1
MDKNNIGIIVGGGPAPGINGVISAATIEAIKCGQRVIGIVGGFKTFEGNKDG